jgi:hypothetical protein
VACGDPFSLEAGVFEARINRVILGGPSLRPHGDLALRTLLADSTHLTAVWCTFPCSMTLLAGSKTSKRLEKEVFSQSPGAVWRLRSVVAVDYAPRDRRHQRSEGAGFLHWVLRPSRNIR